MARAYFDQNPFGAAPIEQGLDTIRRTYSQKAPSPMDNLSKAIQQPFVENVIIPGISRIRDEMRLSEQEGQIAEKAAAARAQGAQLMQQAAARQQQGLDAEIAYGVSGVNVPLPALEALPMAGPDRIVKIEDAKLALADLSRLAAEARAAGRDPARMVDEGGAWPRHMALLREAGMADVAIDVLYGQTQEAAALGARTSLQQYQQSMGEQEAIAAAKQRFGQALVGGVPQAAAEQAVAGQALTPMMVNGRPGVRTRGYEGDEEQGRIDAIATRAYRKADREGKSREESVAIGMEAARAAQPEAVAAQAAQEAQAIQQPQLIEQANRLREQATALEAEAKGIEETPVYRDFGSHAMAFLEALETGDVAKQNALMASVGGSVDEQPFGDGAMGKAIGGDAGRNARAKLLDLKGKYLAAQRREKTGLKLIAARKPAPKAKKTGGGGGYGKDDQRLMDPLVTLNRGEALSDGEKDALKRAGLKLRDIAALDPLKPASWRALVTRMKGKRARADARAIMTGQPTPEETGVRKLAADEKAAQNAIKKLKEEVKLATGEEKKRKEEELARLTLDTRIGSATTRRDTAVEDLIKAEYAVLDSVTAQEQLREDIASDKAKNDPVFKTNKERLLKQAEAKEKAQERIRATQEAKKKRLDNELKALEARRDAMPAASN